MNINHKKHLQPMLGQRLKESHPAHLTLRLPVLHSVALA